MPRARRRPRHLGPFYEEAVRAVQEALHERLIDRCWDELKEVFERPDVKEAETVILRAMAEMFAPRPVEKKRARRKARSKSA